MLGFNVQLTYVGIRQVKYANLPDIGTIYNGRLKQVGSDWTVFMFYRTSHMFSIVASPAVFSNIYFKSVIQFNT